MHPCQPSHISPLVLGRTFDGLANERCGNNRVAGHPDDLASSALVALWSTAKVPPQQALSEGAVGIVLRRLRDLVGREILKGLSRLRANHA